METGPAHLPGHGSNLEPLHLLTLNDTPPPAAAPPPLKEFRVGLESEAPWETGRTSLQIIRYFQEILLAQRLLGIEKSTKILHGDVCSSWLAATVTRPAVTFCKPWAWWPGPRPSPASHTSCPTLPLHSGLPRALKRCLLGSGPHAAPSKTELLTFRLCAFS